jgi:hypothetical protein
MDKPVEHDSESPLPVAPGFQGLSNLSRTTDRQLTLCKTVLPSMHDAASTCCPVLCSIFFLAQCFATVRLLSLIVSIDNDR